jgi:hypothetical protein
MTDLSVLTRREAIQQEANDVLDALVLDGYDEDTDVAAMRDLLALSRAQQEQIAMLRAALRLTDDAIQRGQGCRSEAEFARWMNEAQLVRPQASLTSTEGTPS